MIDEILAMHEKGLRETGGLGGVRERGILEAAVAQSRMSFGGQLLYPTAEEQAATLAFALVMNHPFFDGNKRIGHVALEATLLLNDLELRAEVEEAEAVILRLAAGELERDAFVAWVRAHVFSIELS